MEEKAVNRRQSSSINHEIKSKPFMMNSNQTIHDEFKSNYPRWIQVKLSIMNSNQTIHDESKSNQDESKSNFQHLATNPLTTNCRPQAAGQTHKSIFWCDLVFGVGTPYVVSSPWTWGQISEPHIPPSLDSSTPAQSIK